MRTVPSDVLFYTNGVLTRTESINDTALFVEKALRGLGETQATEKAYVFVRRMNRGLPAVIENPANGCRMEFLTIGRGKKKSLTN